MSKMLELGPTLLLRNKQITKKRRNANNRESLSLMRFTTSNFYTTSMLLLRILERLSCGFMCILKSFIFNLHINSVRKEY